MDNFNKLKANNFITNYQICDYEINIDQKKLFLLKLVNIFFNKLLKTKFLNL